MKKTIHKSTKKQWFIWSGLLLILLFLVWNRDLIFLLLDGDIDAIRSFLDKNLGYALFFLFVIMLIQNSFTVFPLVLVITINIKLFGFANGFLWSWATSIVSSLIVYYCIRYIFQKFIMEKVNHKLVEKIDANGFAYIFQARIFPFVPTSIVNIIAGISTIRIVPFLFATILGNGIYFFILALIPAGILSSGFDEYVIWIIIASAIILYYVVKMGLNKRKSTSNERRSIDR